MRKDYSCSAAGRKLGGSEREILKNQGSIEFTAQSPEKNWAVTKEKCWKIKVP